MARIRPKVKRKNRGKNSVAMVLAVVAAALLGVVVWLVTSGGLFQTEPATGAQRDYQLLVAGAKSNPKDPAVFMTLAEVEWQLGKKAEAVKHADAAVTLAGEQVGYRTRAASIYLLAGKTKVARTLVDSEIKLSKQEEAEPFFVRAQINRTEKKLDAALDDMRHGLNLSPTAADMMVLYGDILAESGKKDAAIAQYQQALRFLPGDQRAEAGLKKLGAKVPASATSTAHASGTGL